MTWQIAVTANAILLVVYLAICLGLFVPLAREHQLRANRLGTATAAIFFTCAVGHGIWAFKILTSGSGVEVGGRLGVTPHEAAWDVITASVGIYYWTLRGTFGPLMRGPKLFVDLRERQRQALEINDTIVQGLATAKLALELDQRETSRAAMESTLASTRALITGLIHGAGAAERVLPGDLRRSHAAATPHVPFQE